MRYINGREDYYELPSLEARDKSVNLPGSPARAVDIEMNADLGSNVEKFRWDDNPCDDCNWYFEGAVRLDKEKCEAVKQTLRKSHELCGFTLW